MKARIVRSACLEGRVKPGHADQFDAFILEQIAPLMKRFPGVRATRILRSLEVEDDGPPLYMVFESVYDSVDAMRAAFADPVRQELRQRLGEVMPLFEGRMFHITQMLSADESLRD